MGVTLLEGVANTLSTITIISCVFLKVPQIRNIKRRRSAEGIYVQAMVMEIIGFTVVILYNFINRYTIMTYLEYPIILVQVYVLLYYTLKYKKMLDNRALHVITGVYFTLVFAFAVELLPLYMLTYIMPFTSSLNGVAKVTYVYGIVKTGNADTISLTTWVISISTNFSRLFTIYVDSGDLGLIFNLIVSAILSGSVLGTAMYYQHLAEEESLARLQCENHSHFKVKHRHND